MVGCAPTRGAGDSPDHSQVKAQSPEALPLFGQVAQDETNRTTVPKPLPFSNPPATILSTIQTMPAIAPHGGPLSDPIATTRLTPAERRVVEKMRTARSEAEAAEVLELSPHTVHQHLRNARARRGARTTRQLLVELSA